MPQEQEGPGKFATREGMNEGPVGLIY